MVKSQEVSNKTLLILIVAVTVVTIVSTWFIVSSAFDAEILINQTAQNEAKVSLVIEDSSNDGNVVEEEVLVGESEEARTTLTIEE